MKPDAAEKDIVERLRERPCAYDVEPDGDDYVKITGIADPLCAEAAAEITRLRALLIETQDTIRNVANGGDPEFGDLWRKIDFALEANAR